MLLYLTTFNGLQTGETTVVDNITEHQFLRNQRIHLSCGKYAETDINKITVHLHKWIWENKYGLVPDKLVIDHINRDTLTNYLENLRVVTECINNTNRGIQINNTTGYKGVFWHKLAQKWMAQIKVNKRFIYLGLFNNIIDAARKVNQAYRIYYPSVNIPNPDAETQNA